MSDLRDQAGGAAPGDTDTGSARGDKGISLPALALIGFASALIVLTLRALGSLEFFEIAAFDQSVQWRSGVLAPKAEVVVVGFDDRDLARWNWPVPDGVLNTLIDNAFSAGAAVVGVDIYRDLPVAPGSDRLNETFRDQPGLVGVMKFPSKNGDGVPAPPALADPDRIGFTDMILDGDGLVRRGLLYLGGKDSVRTSLALQTVSLLLKSRGIRPAPAGENDRVLKLGEAVFRPLTSSFGGYHNIDAQGYQYLLDFRRSPSDIAFVPARDLFDKTMDPDTVSGKIILMGVTSQQVKDLFILPVAGAVGQRPTFGVFLHALAADQILRYAAGRNAPTKSLGPLMEAVLVIAAGLLVTIALVRRKRPLAYIAIGASGAAMCLAGGYVAFLADWWLPAIPVALVIVLNAVAALSWRAFLDRRERVALAGLLTSQVSPQVARDLWKNRYKILEGVRPRPSRLTATVLFVDIAGSTTVADDLSPDLLVTWVSDFLEEMAEAAVANHGVIDKFTGDGLLVVFGVPVPRVHAHEIERDARNAVECALEMARRVDQLNARMDHSVLPRIRCRVGIHTGSLSAGNVGTRARMQYTIIGQTANLAARLEGFGKDDPKISRDHLGQELDCRILLSATTVELLPATYNLESMGELELRGSQVPMMVYRLT